MYVIVTYVSVIMTLIDNNAERKNVLDLFVRSAEQSESVVTMLTSDSDPGLRQTACSTLFSNLSNDFNNASHYM